MDFDDIFNPHVSLKETPREELETEEQAPAEETETQEQVEEVAEEPEDHQESDEDTADVQDEDESEEPAPNKPHKAVPLGTFLDMRDKMKVERDRAEELQRRIADIEARDKAPVIERIQYDPYEHPTEFTNQIREEIESKLFNERVIQSRQRALAKHSEEKLNEVSLWAGQKAAQDPKFDQDAFSAYDPVEFAIQQYEAEQDLKLMRSDPEAFARRIAEEKGWFKQEKSVESTNSPAPKTTAKKPRSLTGVGSTAPSKAPVENDYESFDAIFNHKR